MKKGWQTKSLGDVMRLEYGKPLDEVHRKHSGRFPIYGANGEKGRTDKFYCDKPSIIVGRKGSAGEINLAESAFWPLDVTFFVTFDECKYDLRFLYYLLTALELTKLAKGVKPGINRGEVYSKVVAVPELTEQQRIVAILDEAFAGIATAKANAEKNLQNARAIFESHLQAVFAKIDAKRARLGDVAEVQSGGTPAVSNKSFWGGGIPWYSSGELNKVLTSESERTISEMGLANSNAKLFPTGSLLIGMYDTAALKMSILDRDGAFNQAIAGVKPNERIDVEYVLHAINAKKQSLLLQRRGVRQKNLSLGKIKDIFVSLPARQDQIKVVSELRDIATETQRLESLYRRKLTALAALKQSLLHQAFSGQL